MDKPSRDNLSDNVGQIRFSVQDYWVDFLGGLLPGTLFIVAALFSLAPPFYLLLTTITSDYDRSISMLISRVLRATEGTPSMVWLVVASVLTALAYVIGHIFYRRDPKDPNKCSLKYLVKQWKKENPTKQCTEDVMKNEFACFPEDECEFPYMYFNDYLKHRGLMHLSPFVKWKENQGYRTKNYINLLKIRLRFLYPDRIRNIIRNEAHVRLASSVWYVAGAVRWCAILGLAIVFSAFLLYLASLFYNQASGATNEYIARYAGAIGGVALMLFGSWYLRTRVESFLHYQRQREVVHVLETAWVAFRRSPEELNPPFDITET